MPSLETSRAIYCLAAGLPTLAPMPSSPTAAMISSAASSPRLNGCSWRMASAFGVTGALGAMERCRPSMPLRLRMEALPSNFCSREEESPPLSYRSFAPVRTPPVRPIPACPDPNAKPSPPLAPPAGVPGPPGCKDPGLLLDLRDASWKADTACTAGMALLKRS